MEKKDISIIIFVVYLVFSLSMIVSVIIDNKPVEDWVIILWVIQAIIWSVNATFFK